MVDVYYYITKGKVQTSVGCGIKLSESFDKEVTIDGAKKRCFSALLHPKDKIEEYNSSNFKCIKLAVQPKYCFVAEGCLYKTAVENSKVMEMYLKSIKPIQKYIFGSYRMPECLVTSTIIGGNISILSKNMDSPLLFESSEHLYVNNIIENYKEQNQHINDALLYYFYNKLAEIRKFDKIEDSKNGISIFIDNASGEKYIVKIPDINSY